MRRVFKTRHFARWMRETDLNDTARCQAVLEMERGPIDADLGGGVLEKRVALPGRGKSGGVRTLVATHQDDRGFFVFDFEKKVRANASAKEWAALQALATDLLKLSSTELDRQVENDVLAEIGDDPAD